jgi:UDP-glucose 4-epimerase
MILITGGLGFIGLHTARACLDAGESVVLTRYRSSRVPDFLQDEVGKRVFIEPVDMNSPYLIMDVLRKHRPTAICDLFVPRRGTLPAGEDYRVKMDGFLHLLEAARLNDVPRVSHASSVSVYGSVAEGPYRESLALHMTSRSETEAFKKAEEILGNYYAGETGLDIVFLRIGNVYGPLYSRENRTNIHFPSSVQCPLSPDGCSLRSSTPRHSMRKRRRRMGTPSSSGVTVADMRSI